MSRRARSFGAGLDQVIVREGHGEVAFGHNVLETLIKPLREAALRPRSERAWGPAALGCAMWMDDPELISVLEDFANVCIVVTKQPLYKYRRAKFGRLETLAQAKGLNQEAFEELLELAPKTAGQPQVVGPHGTLEHANIGAVRELGFRKVSDDLVPIVHAKLLLLGRMHWSDEHPSGHVADIHYFVPERLWVGSANFTESSRRSLEMGMWTTDPDLLKAARVWLLRLIAMSEPLRSPNDELDPELAPVEYDKSALAEYLHAVRDDPDDGD